MDFIPQATGEFKKINYHYHYSWFSKSDKTKGKGFMMAEGWQPRVTATGSVREAGQSRVNPKQFMRNTQCVSPSLVINGCNSGNRGREPPGRMSLLQTEYHGT